MMIYPKGPDDWRFDMNHDGELNLKEYLLRESVHELEQEDEDRQAQENLHTWNTFADHRDADDSEEEDEFDSDEDDEDEDEDDEDDEDENEDDEDDDFWDTDQDDF